MTKKEQLGEIIEIASGLDESQGIKADNLMTFCTNTVISGLETAIRNCSSDDISVDAKLRIASTIIAYMQELILPIKVAIGVADEDTGVNGTLIARELGAIPEHTSLRVVSTYDEDGMHLRVAVGVEMDIPDEFRDAISKNKEVALA